MADPLLGGRFRCIRKNTYLVLETPPGRVQRRGEERSLPGDKQLCLSFPLTKPSSKCTGIVNVSSSQENRRESKQSVGSDPVSFQMASRGQLTFPASWHARDGRLAFEDTREGSSWAAPLEGVS